MGRGDQSTNNKIGDESCPGEQESSKNQGARAPHQYALEPLQCDERPEFDLRANQGRIAEELRGHQPRSKRNS